MLDRILSLIDSYIEDNKSSDSAMCKKLGIGNGIIGKWRIRKQKPSTDAIIKISEFFDVSTDYLLLGKENSSTVSISDAEWLDLIHKLPPETQRDFMGMMRIYLETHPSVAAETEEELREAK